MKRVLLFAFILAIVLLGCQKKAEISTVETPKETGTVVEESPVATEESAAAREKTKIGSNDELLLCWMKFPPTYISSEEGTAAEIANMVLKEMGQKYRWVDVAGIEWDKIMQDLKSGKYHAFPGLMQTEDQAKMFNFSKPYTFDGNAIFVKKGTLPEVKGNTEEEIIKSLSGKKIGLLKVLEGIIKGYIREYTPVLCENQGEIITRLMNNEFEVGVAPFAIANEQIKTGNLPLEMRGPLVNVSPGGVAFSKTLDPEVVDRWNKAYISVRKKGLLEPIYAKYSVLDAKLHQPEKLDKIEADFLAKQQGK